MQPSELRKVESSTLLQFARATKRLSKPLVAMRMCIGPNFLTASALSGCSPRIQVSSKPDFVNMHTVPFLAQNPSDATAVLFA